jgi:hypothetical protein
MVKQARLKVGALGLSPGLLKGMPIALGQIRLKVIGGLTQTVLTVYQEKDGNAQGLNQKNKNNERLQRINGTSYEGLHDAECHGKKEKSRLFSCDKNRKKGLNYKV